MLLKEKGNWEEETVTLAALFDSARNSTSEVFQNSHSERVKIVINTFYMTR